MKEMTNVEQREWMAKRYLNDMTKEYNKAVESFSERVQSNPADAIRWLGESIVMAEVQRNLVRRIYRGVNQHGFVESMRLVLNQIERDLMNNYGSGGGSSYTRANEDAEREAKSRFHNRVSNYLWRIDNALEEVQKQQDLQENVTDTTEYALRVHYCSLLNQLQESFRNADTAKTQRDKLAASREQNTVRKSLVNLDSLARDLGVNLTNTEN